ncbi:MAG: hypothetical protein WA783_22120 [Phormidesmis sp.]
MSNTVQRSLGNVFSIKSWGAVDCDFLRSINFQLTIMTQPEVQWSSEEKEIAQQALKKAYEQDIEALISSVKEYAGKISGTEDVWQLHDFLSAKRHDIDGKYDDRETFLMFTLSKLIKDRLLTLTDLEDLAADKRAKISLLTRM